MKKAANTVLDRRSYRTGEVIFKEGQDGTSAFIVEKGAVEIWKERGETRVVLGVLRDNALFGEMALIDGAPRMAGATAIEPTVCIVIPRLIFEQKLAKADHFLKTLMRVLMQNVRNLSDRMIREMAERGTIDPAVAAKAIAASEAAAAAAGEIAVHEEDFSLTDEPAGEQTGEAVDDYDEDEDEDEDDEAYDY